MCVRFLSLVFHFGAKGCRSMFFFQRVHPCVLAMGHELGNLSIRVHSSLTVNDSL